MKALFRDMDLYKGIILACLPGPAPALPLRQVGLEPGVGVALADHVVAGLVALVADAEAGQVAARARFTLAAVAEGIEPGVVQRQVIGLAVDTGTGPEALGPGADRVALVKGIGAESLPTKEAEVENAPVYRTPSSATASMASRSVWKGCRLPLKQISPGIPMLRVLTPMTVSPPLSMSRRKKTRSRFRGRHPTSDRRVRNPPLGTTRGIRRWRRRS